MCLCFEPRPAGNPDPDYRRLHQHLCHAGAYAYILVMTSHGPYPFLLRACQNNNWRMIAGKVPDVRGDPCNGLPFPNPRPRTPLPSLAPTGACGRELCHAAFSRWLQRYLDSPAVEESFAWADLVDDDIKLYISIFLCVEL